MKLSALLILYNEEKKIRDCLKSIAEVVDEIVVIHDGVCADSTLEICKEYNARIFIRDHIGDSIPHVPFGIRKCTGDWILKVDADERLTHDLRSVLRGLMGDPSYSAYKFRWETIVNNKNTTSFYKTFLYKKTDISSYGLPHIEISCAGKVKIVDFSVIHETNELDSVSKLFLNNFRKDRAWANLSANLLIDGKVDSYNYDLKNKNNPQVRKLMFLYNYPMIAMFIMPIYSLIHSFFSAKLYKLSYLNTILSLRIPSYYFFMCFYLLKSKFV